jgi:hypothetical protein
VPDKNLPLDRAEHYQYQTDGGELGEYAKDHSQAPCDLSRAQKNREAFAHFNGLASRLGVLEVFPSTRYEHDPNHDAQKKKRDISETSQLRKHHALIIPPPRTAVSSAKVRGW